MKEKFLPLSEGLRACIETAPKAGGSFADLRERAHKALAQGLPSRASESYRFTDSRALAEAAVAHDDSVVNETSGKGSPYNLTSMNDVFKNNEPQGVEIKTLPIGGSSREACAVETLVAAPEVSTAAALNAALFTREYHVTVSPGACPEQPVLLPLLDKHDRMIIRAGPGSRVTFLDIHDILGFRNPVYEIVCEAHSQVALCRSIGGLYFGSLGVRILADGHFHLVQFAISGLRIRQDILVSLAEPEARAVISGLYIIDGHEHCDHMVRIRHDAPRTSSQKTFKGIIAGHSHGVFQGCISVPRDSQKIEGYQMHRGLILSSGARLNAKPELEILADDVRCSHGATLAELDSLSLFYLKSRGINTEVARRLLLGAFASEILEEVTYSPVRSLMAEWLNHRIEAITSNLEVQ